jgi:rhodanese-related sulfurtransferase
VTSSRTAPRLRSRAAPLVLAALAFAPIGVAGCGRGPLAARVAGVDTLEPQELLRDVLQGRRFTVLDVRAPERYAEGHIPGALSISSEHLDGFFASPEAQGPLVAVCDDGLLAIRAVAVGRTLGHDAVLSLSGGMARWREERLPLEAGEGFAPPRSARPALHASALAQGMLVLAAFFVKPVYMLLALLLARLLSRSGEPDLRLLRASLLAFLAGEATCALNYLVAANQSDALELGHELGMIAANALLPWALFEMADRRLLHLTPPGGVCLALRFCGRCWKREAVSCGARQLFLAAVPIFALVSLLPLSLPLRAGGARVAVLGREVDYSASLLLEAVQFRILPCLALLAYLVAFALLLAGERWTRRAAGPFFAGLGISSFALMRFALARSFASMPLWADVWEELTELAAVAAVAALLWVFRSQLGLGRAPAESLRASSG